MLNTFLVTIPSEAGELAGIRRSLREWLEKNGVDEPKQEAVVLTVHEATANAIEHTGLTRDDGHVQIGASIDDRLIRIDVTDTGIWNEKSQDDDERGRGLLIIQGLTDHVEIRPSPGGTTVRMTYSV